jgi:hypothetical protein
MVRARLITRSTSDRLLQLGPQLSRRGATFVIVAFLTIQLGLFLRATLPLPDKLRGPWPWRMFERRGPWERRLVAVGTTSTGARLPIPLESVFRYARGTTRLYAYHQLEALDLPHHEAERAAFAAFLGERMADEGVDLATIDLQWTATHIDTGASEITPIGTFHLPPRP